MVELLQSGGDVKIFIFERDGTVRDEILWVRRLAVCQFLLKIELKPSPSNGRCGVSLCGYVHKRRASAMLQLGPSSQQHVTSRIPMVEEIWVFLKRPIRSKGIQERWSTHISIALKGKTTNYSSSSQEVIFGMVTQPNHKEC